MPTYTAFGLVMSKKSIVSGWSFTYVAFGREQFLNLTMSFSESARFSIICVRVARFIETSRQWGARGHVPRWARRGAMECDGDRQTNHESVI